MMIPVPFDLGDRDGNLPWVSVFPCQVVDPFSGTTRVRGPEMRLQLAVLEDAVLTFHRLAGRGDRRSALLFAEVERWFASEEAKDPFTFVTICDTLGLDPEFIRRGLWQWQKPPTRSVPRKPPLRREDLGVRRRSATNRIARVA